MALRLDEKYRFQFPLWILLALPLVAAIALGKYSALMRDRWYADVLVRQGATVALDDDGFVTEIQYEDVRNVDAIGLMDVDVLPHLVHIRFSRADVSPGVIRDLSRFPQLRSLTFAYCGLSTEELLAVSELDHIESLSLLGGDITVNGIAQLGRLPRLRNLWLGGTQITNETLSPLSTFPSVQYLYLWGCPNVGDEAIPYIADIRSLKVVDISSTGLSSEGGTRLSELLPEKCCVQGIPVQCPDGSDVVNQNGSEE